MVYDNKHGDLRACLTILQSVYHMLREPITTEVLQEHLQIVPDTLWQTILSFKQHRQCVKLANEWYESGYSLRAMLMSLVKWSLENCTDTQIYILAPMMSRIEKQMCICNNPVLLLLEIIVTVWDACKTNI